MSEKDYLLSIEELNISKGETIALVGNNGAGKTTLLRCILNLISFEEGIIEVFDNNISTNDEWKKVTNSFLDERFLIDFLTPKEFLSFTLDAYEQTRTDDLWDGFLETTYHKKLIRDLSTGNQQKTGILSAVITNPELLILDEPFANLDPGSRVKLSTLLKSESQIQIISSHDLTEVIEIADRVLLMENGKIIRDVPCNEDTINQIRSYFTNQQN